jgi:hypothetical protein
MGKVSGAEQNSAEQPNKFFGEAPNVIPQSPSVKSKPGNQSRLT